MAKLALRDFPPVFLVHHPLRQRFGFLLVLLAGRERGRCVDHPPRSGPSPCSSRDRHRGLDEADVPEPLLHAAGKRRDPPGATPVMVASGPASTMGER